MFQKPRFPNKCTPPTKRSGGGAGISAKSVPIPCHLSGMAEKKSETPSSSGSWGKREGGSGERREDNKPVCKYGVNCYRKNPQHHKEFDHPWLDEEEAPAIKRRRLDDLVCDGISKDSPITLSPDSPITQSQDSQTTPSPGSQTTPSPGSQVTQSHDTSSPLSQHSLFYLSHVRGVGSQYNTSHMAVSIKDILSSVMGDMICSAQFNYLIDIPWLMQQYPPDKRKCPLLIVHGEQRDGLQRLRRAAEPYQNITLFQAKLEILFGTHHSKMMLLEYCEGVRVVIHTANLIAKDWDQKTQGVWISPLFPLKTRSHLSEGASGQRDTGFQQDLLDYLGAYGGSALDEWRRRISEHDLSSARVRLIASVPGGHTRLDMSKWGHLKLRKVLSSHCTLPVGASSASDWPVIGQFSSIGSLGPTPAQWLVSEWLTSLSSSSSPSSSSHTMKSIATSTVLHNKTPPLKLVFPSVEDVRSSLEGYMAGGSIPYASQTAAKQPYLRQYLHKWKAEGVGRTRAPPHIKTYMRTSPNGKEVAWILITSANLSKAAWGALEKKGTQLKIRSYEIGILSLPSDQDLSTFHVTSRPHLPPQNTLMSSGSGAVPISGMRLMTPFDLPLTPYTSEDQPWVWNARHMKPDCKGNVWTPP